MLVHRLRDAVRWVRRGLWRNAGRFLVTQPLPFGREARHARRPEFLVRWEIYVEADSPEAAAAEALAAQRNLESGATGFRVRDEWGGWQTIDHSDDTPHPRRLRLVKPARG